MEPDCKRHKDQPYARSSALQGILKRVFKSVANHEKKKENIVLKKELKYSFADYLKKWKDLASLESHSSVAAMS